MQQFATIFVLNLLTSIDNAIVIGGIAKRTRHSLLLIGLVSTILLTIFRTALIMGVLSASNVTGFRIGVGLVVLWVAVRLSELTAVATRRKDTSFLRLIVMIVATDLALSIDNILSLSIVTKNLWIVGFGVFFSLLPLLLLLPICVNVMERMPWIQILAAGFVAELGVDVITDDKLLAPRMPTGWGEVAIRASAAAIVVLYGFWRYRRSRRYLR